MNDCYLCRYLEPFNKMVPIYHPFERGVAEKVILAFAQDPEAQKAATEAGASKASLIFFAPAFYYCGLGSLLIFNPCGEVFRFFFL